MYCKLLQNNNSRPDTHTHRVRDSYCPVGCEALHRQTEVSIGFAAAVAAATGHARAVHKAGSDDCAHL